ncbi:DUF3500 domain-containing protein [Lentzea sp. NPDC092896]|uniref:DUF3500 domain-containing protein n=1 Tax=Lentzea sp. NPDC092896 TaxID=3364127 RepID=UPI00382F6637
MSRSTARRLRPARVAIAGALLLTTLFPGSALGAQPAALSPLPADPTVFAPSRQPAQSGAAVIKRAQEFLAALSAEQRSKVVLDHSLANATRWHTYPEWALGDLRPGLSTGTLSDVQWKALHSLLSAALGRTANEGYDEVRQHLLNDDYLSFGGTREGYGRNNYKIAFLGAPAAKGKWELQFGGHQLAIANTYQDGRLVGATPSFRGIEPQTFTLDGVTYEPERQEWSAFVALLGSLDQRRLRAADLHRSFEDLVMFPGAANWSFPSRPEGVRGAALTPQQRKLVLNAISRYVDDMPAAEAAAFMSAYACDLNDTYVSFAGSKSLMNIGDYVRIDGPRVWIELRMDEPYSTDETAPHSLWRDKVSDYGGTRS